MAKKQIQSTELSNNQATQFTPLLIAPTQVLRGEKCLSNSGKAIARLGLIALSQYWLQRILLEKLNVAAPVSL